MKTLTLTSEQIIQLRLRHKRCRDSRESDRIKAVLLFAQSWPVSHIAKALLIDESSVRRHIKDYLGSNKLSPTNGGSESYLDTQRTAELIAHLEKNLYQHNHQIVAYIKARWQIKFSVSGLHKWLKRNGFVYKQPKGVPYKADAKEQELFIKKYEQLKASTKQDEPILFMDAVHPTQATKITHGWIKKGTDKVVHTNASRTRLNIIGAIELGSLHKAVFNRFDCNINSEVITAFLPQLRQQYPAAKTIHLIMDRAGYHRAHIVHDEAKKQGIKIHFLPPHSPNLNPIERLWKVMNKKARNNTFFTSTTVFRQRIDDFFKFTLPDIAIGLEDTINDNFERLKTVS